MKTDSAENTSGAGRLMDGGHGENAPCSLAPGLYVVATPIGNREDMSPRARRVLACCDLVLAEDTRRLLELARALGIKVPEVKSFNDHNEAGKEERAIAFLEQGKSIALVPDAGTPLVSDPGYRLVCACRKKGIAIHPVPGPSAPVTALSVAGLAPLPHTFLGFPPRDEAGRAKLFSAFAQVPTTLVFFERKDRLCATLETARGILGPRAGAVCRELTKVHEEVLPFRLEDTKTWPRDLLGELTVVLGQPEAMAKTPREEVARLAREFASMGKPKEVARMVQESVHGWNAKDIYKMLLEQALLQER